MWSVIDKASEGGYYQTLITADALQSYFVFSKGEDLKIVSKAPLDETVRKEVVRLYDQNKQSLDQTLTGWFEKSGVLSIYFVDQKV